MKTKLVAELGCTHLGSLAVAEDMVDACIEAGIDEVKGQLRWPQEAWKVKPRDSGYGATFWDHQTRIELPRDGHLALKERLAQVGKPYYVSVWDEQGAKWAGENFDIVKIAAPLCDHWNLYDCAMNGRRNKPEFYVSIPPLADRDVAEKLMQTLPVTRVYACVPMYPTPLTAAPLYDFPPTSVYYSEEWGYSLHVAYPELEVAVILAVGAGVDAIEFHIAPYNEQRQKGARMGVPLHALPRLVHLVRAAETLVGNGPNFKALRAEAEAKMRKAIEGLRG